MPGYEWIGEEESEQVASIFANGGVLFRHGFDSLRKGSYKVLEFEKKFSKHVGVSEALAVTSGTSALKIALKALGVGPGDEVITQSFTFVATVEAIVEVGATPVIAEVDLSLNMNPQDLKKKITSATKAVIPVHMLGTPARMREILSICKEADILVLEDSAWGCGGKLGADFLGTMGDAGAYSFDYAKTITTGEGGMVVTKMKKILDFAKAYHDHGHENNPNLPRWEDSRSNSGFNYRMSEMQGAVGLAQLTKLDQIVSAQRKVHDLFSQELSFPGISFREEPPQSYGTADAFTFFVASKELALVIRADLVKAGLGTKILPEAISWHFAGSWSHISQLKDQYPNLESSFPESRAILEKAVCIPISLRMDNALVEKYCRVIRNSLEAV